MTTFLGIEMVHSFNRRLESGPGAVLNINGEQNYFHLMGEMNNFRFTSKSIFTQGKTRRAAVEVTITAHTEQRVRSITTTNTIYYKLAGFRKDLFWLFERVFDIVNSPWEMVPLRRCGESVRNTWLLITHLLVGSASQGLTCPLISRLLLTSPRVSKMNEKNETW